MNKEVKAKWVDALRSGEYQQCKGALKTEAGYCCLGVLVDLYRKETGRGTWFSGTRCQFVVGNQSASGLPPSAVLNWAGLGGCVNPQVKMGDGREENLVSLNDKGTPFSRIADLIEECL